VAEWLTLDLAGPRVRLRRDRRARRLVLRVPGGSGPPVLTVPAELALAEVHGFLAEHRVWLEGRLATRPRPSRIEIGGTIPVAGRPVRIAAGPRMRLDLEAGLLQLPGPAPRMAAQAGAVLRERARAACSAAVARYAAALDRRHGRITLRDPRSRWGSCTSRGDLMFSWRLAMAPPDVLDYVVAHEVAHLVEMNHSARFWAVVARLRPDHAASQAWLKRRGAELHRYAFRPEAARETA
jgi:predicted metal-dependent hydrolase